MNRKRFAPIHLAMAVVLCALAALLARAHMRAWDLGGRSPVLSYDSAQYALAARELADHGRVATSFALPVELVRHARPPWPLAALQPGLVVAEAALFRLRGHSDAAAGDPREWLVVVLPLLCFAGAGIAIGVTLSKLLGRHAPQLSAIECAIAGTIVAAAFLLDPEAQHFATGGFTELPFTLGLLLAIAALALEWAPARPFVFGLLLGVTGTFRANMLWLAPLFAIGAAVLAPRERRATVLIATLAGYAFVSAPWWIYKWRAFGSPGWDLTRWVVWDGVGGRSWYSIYHQPHDPDLPHGAAAVRLMVQKLGRTLPDLLLTVGTGPRALWLGALAIWSLLPGPRGPRVAAWVTLAALIAGMLTAAASIPWLRYVFPARVVLEAAGLVALWALVAHYSDSPGSPVSIRTRALAIGAAALAIVWGIGGTLRGLDEASATAAAREVPSSAALVALADSVQAQTAPGEPIMSNLGPILAWSAHRPVVHLALAPGDVDACRRLLDLRSVVLVYRDAEHAGPGWGEIVSRPSEAPRHVEWNILRARAWTIEGGFRVVWLEMGPLRAQVALRPSYLKNTTFAAFETLPLASSTRRK